METQNTNKRNLVTSSQIFFIGLVLMSSQGLTRTCPANIAATTIYYVPHVRDFCPSGTPCQSFRNAVRLQGSGTLTGNRLLTYTGRTIPMGNCSTAFGASGNCLKPFLSIAADPRYYRMGDIIEMPNLRGRSITLPDGRKMIHPGYLIVQDTGGAIKGRNRFDVFTGSMGMRNPQNDFGLRGSRETQMVDRNDCSSRKAFTVVRRNSAQYEMSLAAIDNAVSSSRTNNIMLAGEFGTSRSGGVH